MEWNLIMKKIIYSLGLSVLLSCPAWAQEQPVAEQKAQAPVMTEEDAQTIFFSEDFLNDLTSDNDEIQIFNDIPLDKENSDLQPQTAPQNVAEPNKNQIQPQPIPQAQPAPQTQPQPTIIPIETDAKQKVDDTVLPPAQKNMVEPKVEPQNIPTEKKVEAPIKTGEEKVSQPTVPVVQNKVEIPAKPQSAEQPQAPVISQPATPAEKMPINSSSSPEQIQEEKPSLQEAIEEKIAPHKPVPSIAPSLPKKNAFSLDGGMALPENILNEGASATNMLNRGIRISPEQRARMMMKKKFSEMDLNHDGIISKDEFIQYKTAEAQKISIQVFQQIDGNGDNILSEKEYDILMDKMIENYINPPKHK